MARNAMFGAVFLALIEGVSIAISKAMMKVQMDAAGGRVTDTLEPPIPVGYGSKDLLAAGVTAKDAAWLASAGVQLQ